MQELWIKTEQYEEGCLLLKTLEVPAVVCGSVEVLLVARVSGPTVGAAVGADGGGGRGLALQDGVAVDTVAAAGPGVAHQRLVRVVLLGVLPIPAGTAEVSGSLNSLLLTGADPQIIKG